MIGDVLFHMLPQILGTYQQNNDHNNPQICLILNGILLFVFFDFFIIKLKNLRDKRDEPHDYDHNDSSIVFLFWRLS
ncbi:unnamed protein product [Paramecium pentaurelia]|uniref:Uncharacterized protein n=1 Tax=Paramecium pentaurelia TaxID=43138 RepID=A0A8S1UBS0_9CILI|nr:unnamed protein product [Paramecium pentaurelia]